jgi:3'-phosphoadenosine 5'-phosphosulfate sulfotransferase (PAPS reductase)/FAD synthetase
MKTFEMVPVEINGSDPTLISQTYDKIIVAFSGGKDSLACLLYLLELGTPKSKIELWHHDIDGRESTPLMDWPCTRSYCEAVALGFGIPLFFSWREGGFEREMLRNNSHTGDVFFESPAGTLNHIPSRKLDRFKNTRLKFPQVSPDLKVRWCSAYLKIDVFASAIRNQPRFTGLRTLVVTGERGQESPARSRYEYFEKHAVSTSKRVVDQWRPVLNWDEQQVWNIIQKFRVRPHPAYFLGFSRVSCLFCIFGNANQFASARHLSPDRFNKLSSYEKQFGCTVKRKISLDELVSKGTVYPATVSESDYKTAAMSENFTLSIFIDEWRMPSGAFGDGCGPS